MGQVEGPSSELRLGRYLVEEKERTHTLARKRDQSVGLYDPIQDSNRNREQKVRFYYY